MSFPPAAHQELGILRAIVEAGGTAMREDPSFYGLIALYFPEIDGDDLRRTTDTGKDLWTSRCQRLFIRLTDRGEIDAVGGDTLEITAAGLARLQKQWLPEWGPNPIQLPPAPEPPPPDTETPPPGMWPGAPPPPPGM